MVCFLTQYFLQSCRGKSPKSSVVHPHQHRGLCLDLLLGIFWCLGGTHPHGALLPDSPWQSLSTGFSLCWVGPCQIRRGCWHPLCSFIQVSEMAFSSLTVRCSGIPALGIERQEEGYIIPCRRGSRCPGLSCFCMFSLLSVLFFSLLNTMFAMSWLIYTMAEDGLLFRFLARINARTRTHITVIIISGKLAGR